MGANQERPKGRSLAVSLASQEPIIVARHTVDNRSS